MHFATMIHLSRDRVFAYCVPAGKKMPFVELAQSEHAPGMRPVTIHYREKGCAALEMASREFRGAAGGSKAGPSRRTPKTIVFLHGGWGYVVYPIDAQVTALGDCVKFIVPDRSGYGKSSRVPGEMPTDFHRRAATETIAALDALQVARPVIWGHSDGAVIGAMIGLMAPQRISGLVLEAFHFCRNKPRSRGFFERFTARPEDLGEDTRRLLGADHGEDWARVVQRNCGAWIRIADESARPDEDLYGGRLGELRVSTLFLHGEDDPRTEPDEMERVRKTAPRAKFCFVKDGHHSPHSEDGARKDVNAALEEFFRGRQA